MAFKMNIFTGTLDIVEGVSTTWLAPVATRASLPSGDSDGAVRVVLDEELAFQYDSGTDTWYAQRDNLTSFSNTSDPDGVTVEEITTIGTPNIIDYEITLRAADSSNPGGVSTGAQNFAGDKTFDNDVIITGDLTVNGITTTINTATLDVEDANITINKNGTQATADANDSGLTIEMSDATDVVLGYDSTLTSRMKLGDLGDEREVMTVSHSQIVTNKDMSDTSNVLTTASSDSFTRETGNQQLVTIPDTASPENFVLEDFTQTLTNKTLDNTNTITLLDENFTLQDNGDNTKQAQFELSSISTATTREYILPDGNTILVGTDLIQIITNKDLSDSSNDLTTASSDSFTRASGNQQLITIPDSAIPDNFVLENFTQTLSNKTLDNTSIITIQDDNFILQDDGDNTKQVQFQLSGITTATTRTFTFPDADDTIVVLDASQTLTNKVLDGTDATGTNTISIDATDASYDNGASGLAATEVQAAIDELSAEKVDGPASATDEAIARYDGTTGKLIQNSSITIDDSGIMNGATQLNVDNLRLDGNTISSTDTNGNIILSPDGTGETQVNNNLSIQDEAELRLEDSGGTNYMGLKAPSTVTSSTTLSLPDGDGSPNQALTTDGATNLQFTTVPLSSAGDLDEISAALADNQAVATSVTGLVFANGTVRSADIHYSIVIDATSDLYEEGTMKLIQRGADWQIARQFSGDDSLVDFTVNTSGQILYTTPTYAGFVSGTINFRAITTSI